MQMFPLYLVAVMHVSSLETARGQHINMLGYFGRMAVEWRQVILLCLALSLLSFAPKGGQLSVSPAL